MRPDNRCVSIIHQTYDSLPHSDKQLNHEKNLKNPYASNHNMLDSAVGKL